MTGCLLGCYKHLTVFQSNNKVGPDIFLSFSFSLKGASLVAQMVKRLPAMWETQVQSLGWEDPLEKEMATDSSTLAWRISWAEELGWLWSMGSHRVEHE